MAHYISDVLRPLKSLPSQATPTHFVLKAIVTEKHVERAFTAFKDELAQSQVETTSDGPVVRLLNCISTAYHKHVLGPDFDEAIIFTSSPNHPPLGDYLALGTRPDVYAFAGQLGYLMVARSIANHRVWRPWSVILEVGDLKRLLSADGQVKSYVTANKRYRPDLPTIHAFSLGRRTIRLVTLNACGLTESPAYPATAIWPWIAHVVQVYQAYEARDRTIQHCSAQQSFYRWDVRTSTDAIAVTPFHVGHAPGRTTFACFEVDRLPPDPHAATNAAILAELDQTFDSGVAQGFWKLSWQRTTPRSSERELLDYAHRDGWVPGLVRHHTETSSRDAFEDAIYDPSGTHPRGRVKDILHLGSVGQPLSQCETAGDLLDAMYDLIVTHLHLFRVGILHRDVSWFNVLYKPRHYLEIHPKFKRNQVLESPYPCIGRILGIPDAQPSILLADLDHALKLSESDIVVGPDGKAAGSNDQLGNEDAKAEKTGTPMFMSVQLLDDSAIFFGKQSLDELWEAFKLAEESTDSFSQAFPQGDAEFMARFKAVRKAERKRKQPRHDEMRVPVDMHNLRHDAESMYWVFLWAFARARPIDADPNETAPAAFDQFCAGMLRQNTGRQPDQTERATWLIPSTVVRLFHPLLCDFESLFMQMATYLSIPWHLYPDMPDDHVQSAFRRLILAFRFDNENVDALGVRLDTAAPRFTRAFVNVLRMDGLTTDKGAAPGASVTKPGSGSGVVGRAQKRKADGEASGAPAKKRALSSALATAGDDALDEPSDAPVSPVAGQSAEKIDAHLCRPVPVPSEMEAGGDDKEDESDESDSESEDESCDAADDSQDDAGDSEPTYSESEHLHSQSVKALRLMFLKDRSLWFGAGK
ncbi:hypothetical protein AURDEDRAFT_163934 [Auricularia subglabra TFB-10046 SS5]|nr:hypothetical protein AURDEDRAFT_163934 [Auricularia subglabra TFB-10046 SS5]